MRCPPPHVRRAGRRDDYVEHFAVGRGQDLQGVVDPWQALLPHAGGDAVEVRSESANSSRSARIARASRTSRPSAVWKLSISACSCADNHWPSSPSSPSSSKRCAPYSRVRNRQDHTETRPFQLDVNRRIPDRKWMPSHHMGDRARNLGPTGVGGFNR